MSCYPAILNGSPRIDQALGHSTPLAKLIVYIKPRDSFINETEGGCGVYWEWFGLRDLGNPQLEAQ